MATIQATERAAEILRRIGHKDAYNLQVVDSQGKPIQKKQQPEDWKRQLKPGMVSDIEEGKLRIGDGSDMVVVDRSLASSRTARLLAISEQERRSQQESRLAARLDAIKATGGQFGPSGINIEIQEPIKETNNNPLPSLRDTSSFEKAVNAQQQREINYYQNMQPITDFNKKVSSYVTFGSGKNIEERGTIGRLTQKAVMGPMDFFSVTLPALPSIATEKAYLFGRGIVVSPSNTLRETYIDAPKRTASTVYDPRKDEGKLTFAFAAIGAGVSAGIANYKAPVRPDIMGEVSRSYKYSEPKASTYSNEPISIKDLHVKDTHSFVNNLEVISRKPVVEVMRGQKSTSVRLGETVYAQASSGTKVSVWKLTESGKMIDVIYKNVRFPSNPSYEINVGKTVTRTVKPYNWKVTEKKSELISAVEKPSFSIQNKLLDARIDTVKTTIKAETNINYFKKLKYVETTLSEHGQKSKVRASQNYMSQEFQALDLNTGIKLDNYKLEGKGKYPTLEYGEVSRPQDSKSIVRNWQKGDIDFRIVENQRGSRFIREIDNTYKETGAFDISKQFRKDKTIPRFLGDERGQLFPLHEHTLGTMEALKVGDRLSLKEQNKFFNEPRIEFLNNSKFRGKNTLFGMQSSQLWPTKLASSKLINSTMFNQSVKENQESRQDFLTINKSDQIEMTTIKSASISMLSTQNILAPQKYMPIGNTLPPPRTPDLNGAFPFPLIEGGGSFSYAPVRRKKGKGIDTSYMPSLRALDMGIKAPKGFKKSDFIGTGFEVRPL